jgi:hypothetical protein
MRKVIIYCLLLAPRAQAADNELTPKEKADG